MSDPLVIRPAVRDDAPVILDLIKGLAVYERLAHEVVATPDAVERTLFGPRPAAEVLMAEWQGEPVAFALFFSTYSTFLAQPGLWLEDLFVKPGHRGRGIGARLLASLAGIAVQRNCGRLEWAVLDWNEPAIAFYRRLGALPQDEWTTWRMTGDSLELLAASAENG